MAGKASASVLEVIKERVKMGPTGFFKGCIPAFVRIGPQTIITFIVLEHLTHYFGYLDIQKSSQNMKSEDVEEF